MNYNNKRDYRNIGTTYHLNTRQKWEFAISRIERKTNRAITFLGNCYNCNNVCEGHYCNIKNELPVGVHNLKTQQIALTKNNVKLSGMESI